MKIKCRMACCTIAEGRKAEGGKAGKAEQSVQRQERRRVEIQKARPG